MRNDFTVLVTGGAGYIGSHAVLALRDAGWSVVVIDDLSTGFRRAIPDDVPLYVGNVGDKDLLRCIFTEQRVGAIMHFAGSIIVSESVEKPLDYYRNNTLNSLNLVSAAVEAGIGHIIFSSTAAVYGTGTGGLIDEDTPKAPINPYGMSKLMTEYMLADAARAHPLNCGILRYFNVAGADPAGRTGQSTVGATHLIKVAVEAVLGRRAGVAVYGTDYDTADGTGVRDYIHVSDLAAAHVLALEALVADKQRSFTFNCGYGRGFSVLEVLDAVDRVSGKAIKRTLEGRRAGDPDVLIADSTRIREQLGWQPAHDDLDRIVAHALAWETALLTD